MVRIYCQVSCITVQSCPTSFSSLAVWWLIFHALYRLDIRNPASVLIWAESEVISLVIVNNFDWSISDENPNIALHKPAYQISTNWNYTATLAVDGVFPWDTSVGSDHSAETNNSNIPIGAFHWWIVDLQRIYTISDVYFYGTDESMWNEALLQYLQPII